MRDNSICIEIDGETIIESLMEQVFENEYQIGPEIIQRVQHVVGISNEKTEQMLARVDQEALNKFTLVMVETVVKRLDYQINANQIQQCKMWLNTFKIFAQNSKRFRDTVRRSHSIHLWLGLLRNSIQWDTHILNETLDCMDKVISDINAAFSMEYVYWKKFIPELVELYQNSRRRYHQNFEKKLEDIFTKLLKCDFSFLAHAHSQLESRRFHGMVQIANMIAAHNEFEWSNYKFCHQLASKLRKEELPEGIGETHPERRRMAQLVQCLETVWEHRVRRASDGDQAMSTSSDERSGDDDEEGSGEEEEETTPKLGHVFTTCWGNGRKKQQTIVQISNNTPLVATTYQLHYPQPKQRPAVTVEEEEQEEEGGGEEMDEERQEERRPSGEQQQPHSLENSPGGNGRKRLAGDGEVGTEEEEGAMMKSTTPKPRKTCAELMRMLNHQREEQGTPKQRNSDGGVVNDLMLRKLKQETEEDKKMERHIDDDGGGEEDEDDNQEEKMANGHH